MPRGGRREGAGRPKGSQAAKRAAAIDYSDELANAICEEVALGGMLKEICARPGMPSRVSVWRWRQEKPAFDKLYREACAAKAEAWEDELRQIADDGRNDFIDEDGKRTVNHDLIKRSELRAKVLMWLMEKHGRATYGERKAVDVSMNTTLADDLEKARQRLIDAGVE